MCMVKNIQYTCLHSDVETFVPCVDGGNANTRKCPKGGRTRSTWRKLGKRCDDCRANGRARPRDTFAILNLIRLRAAEEAQEEAEESKRPAAERAAAERERAAAEQLLQRQKLACVMRSVSGDDSTLASSKIVDESRADSVDGWRSVVPSATRAWSDDGTMSYMERPYDGRRRSL